MRFLFPPLLPPYQYVSSNPFGAHPDKYKSAGMPGHEGVDFMVLSGSPVYAVFDGRISQVAKGHKFYGTFVRLNGIGQAAGYQALYAHLLKVIVSPSDLMKAGDIIGFSGNTGASTGPHLHFTLKQHGATQNKQTTWPADVIDPTRYLKEVMAF